MIFSRELGYVEENGTFINFLLKIVCNVGRLKRVSLIESCQDERYVILNF